MVGRRRIIKIQQIMGSRKSKATEGCGAFVTKTSKKVQATAKGSKRIPADIFAQQVDDVKIHTETVILHPKSWNAYKSAATLSWKHVDFDAKSRAQVPKVPGLYAFAVQPPHGDFPPGSWLFYVGEVGSTASSSRTLWVRYKEYLDELKVNIRRKVGTYLYRYDGYVRFYYCHVDPNQHDIKQLESELISSLWPDANIADFNATTRPVRKAFS